MTPSETKALEAIRGYAHAGRVRLHSHARKRKNQRNVPSRDIWHALKNAQKCETYEDGWRVFGPDIDGDELVCGVTIDDGVLVITLF